MASLFQNGRLSLVAFCLFQAWVLCLASTDPCLYVGRTRPKEHYEKPTGKEKVIMQDGTPVDIHICKIHDGRRCYPDGVESFTFEEYLTKAGGVASAAPTSVSTKIPVDKLQDYELRLKSFSCKSGYCSQKTNGICNGTMGVVPDINFEKLYSDMKADTNLKISGGQTVFQLLRDICYYVRKSRFAVEGDKEFYPGVADIQWMRSGEKQTIEICDIANHNECFPRDEVEENHFLEYLLFMQKNRSSLVPTKGGERKKGPTITVKDGSYYFYRVKTVWKVLDWSCQSGHCSKDRKCEPDPSKNAKTPFEFYEYEADIDRLKPKSDATRIHHLNSAWMNFLVIFGIWLNLKQLQHRKL